MWKEIFFRILNSFILNCPMSYVAFNVMTFVVCWMFFCCILMSWHMLRHWTVYSWGLDKNYTLALRILEQSSGGRVAAKIDCARPCFFHLPSFKMPMQWHHYERFSSATIPRTKETMCPRSEDAKVYKVDVQKRDIPNIYLSILLLTTCCYCLMKSGKATST